MMTTLRRDRRTQRTAKFNLESLDDRIVPSAMGGHAAIAGHAHAAERAHLIQQRHEARIARHAARHEARLAAHAARHAATIPSVTATPIMNSASLATTPSSATNSAMTSGTVTTPSATTNFFPLPFQTNNPTATMGTTTPSNPTSGSTTPLPPNVSAQLQSLYQQFESSGGSGNFTPTGLPGIVISGSNVGINVHTSDPANFNAVLAQLQSDGMQVTNSSPTYGLIEGMLPIAQLPAVAQISDLSITPQTYPTLK